MTRRVIPKSEKPPHPTVCRPSEKLRDKKTKGQVTYFALEVKATSKLEPKRFQPSCYHFVIGKNQKTIQ